jgi:hypothetical protein
LCSRFISAITRASPKTTGSPPCRGQSMLCSKARRIAPRPAVCSKHLPPALKRLIKVETVSRSAEALVPPHKCGAPTTNPEVGRSHASSLSPWRLPALKRVIKVETRSSEALLPPHECGESRLISSVPIWRWIPGVPHPAHPPAAGRALMPTRRPETYPGKPQDLHGIESLCPTHATPCSAPPL